MSATFQIKHQTRVPLSPIRDGAAPRSPHPRGGRVAELINWFDRTPQILMDEISIYGENKRIKKLGSGDFHQIYEFLDDSTKILKVINRGPNGKCNAKNTPANQLMLDIREISIAEQAGIPMPICFIRPDTYDPERKDIQFGRLNGGFFVMERIPHQVQVTWSAKPQATWSETEIKIMNFVGQILGIHIKMGCEVVSDFYPRNVMMRKDGSLVVIDLIHPDPIEDLKQAVWEKVDKWSGGNEQAKAFITKDFPHGWLEEPHSQPAKRQRISDHL